MSFTRLILTASNCFLGCFSPSIQPVRNLFRCPSYHPILTLSAWCSRNCVNRAVIFLSCSRIWLIFLLPVEQQVRLGHAVKFCCFPFHLSCTNISLEVVMCKNPESLLIAHFFLKCVSLVVKPLCSCQ